MSSSSVFNESTLTSGPRFSPPTPETSPQSPQVYEGEYGSGSVLFVVGGPVFYGNQAFVMFEDGSFGFRSLQGTTNLDYYKRQFNLRRLPRGTTVSFTV